MFWRLRLGGEQLLGARPHQAGRAHRRDADRRRVFAAEQLDLGVGLALDAVARQQLDRLERVGVALDAVFLGGAAVDEVEAEARHAPARLAAQIVDGGITLAQPRRGTLLGCSDLGRPSSPPQKHKRQKAKRATPRAARNSLLCLTGFWLAASGAPRRRLHHDRRHAETNGCPAGKRKECKPRHAIPFCGFLRSAGPVELRTNAGPGPSFPTNLLEKW